MTAYAITAITEIMMLLSVSELTNGKWRATATINPNTVWQAKLGFRGHVGRRRLQ
jgi:hypothetical protein